MIELGGMALVRMGEDAFNLILTESTEVIGHIHLNTPRHTWSAYLDWECIGERFSTWEGAFVKLTNTIITKWQRQTINKMEGSDYAA